MKIFTHSECTHCGMVISTHALAVVWRWRMGNPNRDCPACEGSYTDKYIQSWHTTSAGDRLRYLLFMIPLRMAAVWLMGYVFGSIIVLLLGNSVPLFDHPITHRWFSDSYAQWAHLAIPSFYAIQLYMDIAKSPKPEEAQSISAEQSP